MALSRGFGEKRKFCDEDRRKEKLYSLKNN
jgi:hypothetical protein